MAVAVTATTIYAPDGEFYSAPLGNFVTPSAGGRSLRAVFAPQLRPFRLSTDAPPAWLATEREQPERRARNDTAIARGRVPIRLLTSRRRP
jgi:hypothetical protein